MLNPGIYYPGKNAHRQVLNTLPGRNLYPVDSNFVPYTEQPCLYVNRVPQYPVGDVVDIYLNGVLAGTTAILDATRLYVIEFPLNQGAIEVQSVFSDGNTATQTFFCVQLYGLLSTASALWSEQRQANLRLLSSQYLTPQTTGLFRGQADQALMSDNFGEVIGFPQPFDWSFEQYALTLGGDPATGRPGAYAALTKGSCTGAIKDMVMAVTGYAMTDQDFNSLQQVGWRLGRAAVNDCTIEFSYNPASPLIPPFPVSIQVLGYANGSDVCKWVLGAYGATGATMGISHIGTTGNLEMAAGYGVFAHFDTIAEHCAEDSWQATVGATGPTGAGPTVYTHVPPYRYRYSGDPSSPVRDNDPTNVNGPHYYLRGTTGAGSLPIATIKSGIRQAYTMLLKIKHDGFLVVGESVLRQFSSTTDSLNYDWLNPWGTAVTITQGATTYVLGTNFKVDYTYGQIIWLDSAAQPIPGTAYQVSYTYFPKQILTTLLNLVKPATMKLILQFATSDGVVFNPYQWGGVDNPSGHVILPE